MIYITIAIAKCTLNILLPMHRHHFLNYTIVAVEFLNLRDESSVSCVLQNALQPLTETGFILRRVNVAVAIYRLPAGREARINRGNFGNSAAASGNEIANSC